MFHEYLCKPPVLHLSRIAELNLMIDGSYFSNEICLIIYRENNRKRTQFYRVSNGEYFDEIKEDLANLLLLEMRVESVTCDGHKSILKAVKSICPEAALQRCVVHIQRECSTWLTAHPQSTAGVDLLKIVHQIHQIKSHNQAQLWMQELIHWHHLHKGFINEKSYQQTTGRYWFKHKLVRKAFVHLRNALPNMFLYLFNPRIPKSTNGLESFFGHLKSHLQMHRGLTKTHRINFMKWYLYFKNCV